MKNMTVMEAIRKRRSIRKFKPGAEVTDEQIKLPFNVMAVGVPDEDPSPRGQYDESKVSYI